MANREQLPIIVVGLILVFTLSWMYWHSSQPRRFTLEVANRSAKPVDQVRLFGTALNQDALLLKLDPEQSRLMTVSINKTGTLRVEISQDMNRIDTYIVEDTRILDDLSQRLTIEADNRFLLSDAEDS